MAISPRTSKILWGRAAGRCSEPNCRIKLTETTEDGESYLIGEMAHNIARKIGGPRAIDDAGGDEYENLILLCPTHHTQIDSAPEGEFTVVTLSDWKKQHEAWVDSLENAVIFEDFLTAASTIKRLLDENKYYYDNYGPNSDLAIANPGSNSHAIWVARKHDCLLPNNRKILNILEMNERLFTEEFHFEALKFRDHAMAYEQNQLERLDYYPTFPTSFYKAVLAGTQE
jgi:hypothetical protein